MSNVVLNRIVKLLVLFAVAFGLVSILCIGALFVISGGRPIDFVQTQWIRFQLSGREAELDTPISTDETPIRFIVNPGDTPRVIANNLYIDGLIADPDLFVDYVRVTNLDVQLEAGTYFLTRAQSLRQIAAALTDSRSSQIVFTILEGWRIEEIAAAIDANGRFGFTGDEFLSYTMRGASIPADFAAFVDLPANASLEGFLYPDTYQLPASVTAEELRDILLDTFTERVTAENLAQAAADQGLSLYEAATLASIIQREAVHPDEHPLISSVYRNRLSIGMKLDADPTVQYAIGFANGRWWSPLTIADYSNVISPYNTYLNNGLPPSPIANAAITAIRAAIYPQPSDYYFFRARCSGDGYHNFARTFEEHLANAC